jgi:5-methylcytosine-specific restriction endonuclease McrA
VHRRASYRERERRRPAAQKAVYSSSGWHRLAALVVAVATECHWCHTPATRVRLTADHVVPIVTDPSLGLEPSNVVAACRGCQERRKRRPDVGTWQPWERKPL